MYNFIRKCWKLLESIAKFFFNIFFGIIKKELDDKTWKKIVQFLKFCVVGCMNAVVLIIVSSAVIKLFEINGWTGAYLGINNFYLQLSTVIGFFAKVLNSYYWNGKYVFPAGEKKSFSDHIKGYFKLILSYLVSFIISLGLNVFWKYISLSDYLCNPFNEIITLPLNYILNKFWAFAKKDKKEISNQK